MTVVILTDEAGHSLGVEESTRAHENGVVVEIGGETAAPYTSTVQIDGIVQMVSDGAATFDEGQAVVAGGQDALTQLLAGLSVDQLVDGLLPSTS